MDSIKQPAMMLSIVNTVAVASVTVYGYNKFKIYNEDIAKLKSDFDILNKKLMDVGSISEKFNLLADNVKSLENSSKIRSNGLTELKRDLANLQEDTDELKSIIEQMVKVMKSNNMEVKLQPPEEPPSLFRQKKKQPAKKNRPTIRFNTREDDDDEEEVTEADMENEINTQIHTTRKR